VGWDNPPVPWREFERRLSWSKESRREHGAGREHGTGRVAEDWPAPRRPVTRLPVDHDAPAWAELHCHSSYSFLDGASSPA